MLYEIKVVNINDKDAKFLTVLSYYVTNSSGDRQNWVMGFKYKYDKAILRTELRRNNSVIP